MYKPETKQCILYTDSAILLKSLLDISIEQAKLTRNNYCKEYCSPILYLLYIEDSILFITIS